MNRMMNDLERTDREISEAEAALRAGEPREDLLYQWLQDQRQERKLILEGKAVPNA